jgi:hypothetical protein
MIKQSPAQALGNRGEQWFPAQLPKYWYFQRPSYDLGVDGVVVIAEQNQFNGIEFRVQIKSSREWSRQDDAIVLRGIKRTTARYWAAGASPTLLVFYDDSANSGFCAWALDALPPVPELLLGTSTTITVRANSPVSVDEHCWDTIRTALASRLGRFSQALHSASLANIVLPQIRDIARCIQLLHLREFTPEPQDRDGEMLLALGQSIAHRDIVRATQKILDELDPRCLFARQLSATMEAYKSRVAEFYLGFDVLVAEADKAAAIRENPTKSKELRPEMIQRATELLVNLAGLWHKEEP